MIVLDTHVWVWWVHGDAAMSARLRSVIESEESSGLCVSAISCWEIAKLVELQRLELPLPILDWLRQALAYPGVRLIELTPEIAAAACQLPPPIHRDPADQIIVATARTLQIPVATADDRIRQYPHVAHVSA